jgi:hypothetical protein
MKRTHNLPNIECSVITPNESDPAYMTFKYIPNNNTVFGTSLGVLEAHVSGNMLPNAQ